MATFQLSVAAQNALLDAIETAAGTAAKVEIRTGSLPANCAASTTGTLLASMTLASDWMNAAASNSKTKLGTWQDTSADASGTAGYFRVFDNAGTTCHMQGDITATAGGGAMEIDDTTIDAGQQVTINTYTLAAGNS